MVHPRPIAPLLDQVSSSFNRTWLFNEMDSTSWRTSSHLLRISLSSPNLEPNDKLPALHWFEWLPRTVCWKPSTEGTVLLLPLPPLGIPSFSHLMASLRTSIKVAAGWPRTTCISSLHRWLSDTCSINWSLSSTFLFGSTWGAFLTTLSVKHINAWENSCNVFSLLLLSGKKMLPTKTHTT